MNNFTYFLIIFFSLIIIAVSSFFFWKYQSNKKELLKRFKGGNVLVFGAKGKGKDLLFQKVIQWKKKEKYYANMPYGYNYEKITLKELDIGNTYHNFISENINKIDKIKEMENSDVYISDVGVYLPSQYDSVLHKTYPSFPIYYALSRQLYANNIHANSQNLERAWKALREQADTFVWCRETIKLPFILITRVIVYDKYQSANARLLPMKRKLMNKEHNALYEQYKATNGLIKPMYVINFKRAIKYDTRYFAKLVFKD